ncbi:methylated-DNA--[protein]-cysteine S-methyltransferase [Streptomyces daliensis]|uniref:Methylated-DNA--protein-cysteine methyltransferase n=1 Tax=Streptomyces daliensis TaxID=299421 RepID=A0A8T4IU83_9ACTN|nr:methylated-DNA--[protein]-cysteine S-methyltransferase [Streptomyces daliensis]
MTETTASTARSCAWAVRDTPLGPLLLAATGEGLVNVVFHADAPTADKALTRLAGRLRCEPRPWSGAVPGGPVPAGAEGPGPEEIRDPADAVLGEAVSQLDAYFRGELRAFTVDLDWSLSGGFHARVLHALHESVPFGATVGYQDLADRVGEPGAARAVGAAMGSNPLPVVVACHRVVESGGGIGGFGGGLETKRTLLALEGLLPEPLF